MTRKEREGKERKRRDITRASDTRAKAKANPESLKIATITK